MSFKKTPLAGLFGLYLHFCAVSFAAEPPMYFFYNVAIEQNVKNMAEQLQLAESHGVDTVAFHTGMPWARAPGSDSPARSERFFQAIQAANTNASFIPRCFLEPARIYKELYPDEFPAMPGVDFSKLERHASLGSDRLFRESNDSLRKFIQYYESSELGDSIPVYYLAAQETGEWIPYLYRTGGVDSGKSNADKFRWWLTRKYQTDEALQSTWGDPDVTLKIASVPEDQDGRFPIKGTAVGETVRMFYRLPREQAWVDYSEYISDITVQRISDLAAVVREETGGKKKSLVFYGYVYELAGSTSGHLSMGKLLRNRDVHMLGAPMSYINYPDRLSGGPGGCMSALDSLPLHNKKWISEIDITTYAQKEDAYIPDWYWDSNMAQFDIPDGPKSTGDVLNRIFAFSCAHRSTLWWMDLFGAGWFSDSNLWNTLDQEMGRHFIEMAAKDLAYTPDVAVIVDEKSRLNEYCTWSGFFELYPMLRNNAMLTGASTGFYYLDDYLEGRVPPAKVCLFVNLWKVDPAKCDQIQTLLKQNNSTAIWQYAPGWMNGECAGIEQITGMIATADAGACVSLGERLLKGISWGPAYDIDPRISIDNKKVDVLARYADGEISAARKTQDGIEHYLLCTPGISTEVLRRIYAEADVHLWCSPEGAINTDGKTFVHLHASKDANYKVSIPSADATKVSLKKGGSLFIKLPAGNK